MLTTLLQRFKNLPLAHRLALAITVMCLLSSLIISLVSVIGANKIIQQGTELYGQSLANQLATAASNPLIQRDHLSLQSLANDSVSSAALKRVTIYDMNSQPVVEAGAPYAEDSYSASITYQQSIAGYVVVSYDASSLHRQLTLLCWQLVALALVLAAMVYGLSQDKLNELIGALRGSNTASPQTTRHPASDTELSFALATIHLANQPANNINHTALRHIQQQMLTLCKLYNGTVQLLSSNTLCFQFYQQSTGDSCSFRALCAAYLLQHWMGEHFPDLNCQIGLDLLPASPGNGLSLPSSFDRDLHKHHAIDKLLELGDTHNAAMVATETLCQQPEICERVSMELLAADACVLTNINEPYRTLLLGQLETLKKREHLEAT